MSLGLVDASAMVQESKEDPQTSYFNEVYEKYGEIIEYLAEDDLTGADEAIKNQPGYVAPEPEETAEESDEDEDADQETATAPAQTVKVTITEENLLDYYEYVTESEITSYKADGEADAMEEYTYLRLKDGYKVTSVPSAKLTIAYRGHYRYIPVASYDFNKMKYTVSDAGYMGIPAAGYTDEGTVSETVSGTTEFKLYCDYYPRNETVVDGAVVYSEYAMFEDFEIVSVEGEITVESIS